MKILILETENTTTGKYEDIFKKFFICRSEKEKKRILPHFRRPTVTKNAELMEYAEKWEKIANGEK